MKNYLRTFLFLSLGMAFVGCSRSNSETSGDYVTIKGSDTMVHLASSWAEKYMDTHPSADISVTGGGSGTGIAALLNGTTNLAIASRSMKAKEYDLARKSGKDPQEFAVAKDGIAVMVNPANPISHLTIEQIGKIYTGAITNWSQVGGPDQKIILLSRESSSGTYVFFQSRVLNKRNYTRTALLMPSTAAVVQSVKADTWAIGYGGLAYALEAGAELKILGVEPESGTGPVLPSEATINSGDYPIARALYIYSSGVPKGAAKAFLDFTLTEAGQNIVREIGYVAVR